MAALPESAGFVLAGGAAMAAHGVLNRATRDLDYFAEPDDATGVQRLAEALEHSLASQGLDIQRQRSSATFVRFRVRDQHDESEVDLAIDYRALEPVHTRYGSTLDMRELGANKILALFARAEPRDFVDLAELTMRFPLPELIALAAAKDPGLDLAVLDEFMNRADTLPQADFELDDRAYQHLLATVHRWQSQIRQLHDLEPSDHREEPHHSPGTGLDR